MLLEQEQPKSKSVQRRIAAQKEGKVNPLPAMSDESLFVTLSLETARLINEAFIKPDWLNRDQMMLLREFHQALERPHPLRPTAHETGE